MWVREKERRSVCVCLHASDREKVRERKKDSVCVREREQEQARVRESVCVSVLYV